MDTIHPSWRSTLLPPRKSVQLWEDGSASEEGEEGSEGSEGSESSAGSDSNDSDSNDSTVALKREIIIKSKCGSFLWSPLRVLTNDPPS